MKRLTSILALLVGLTVVSTSFAQDSTKTQAQKKNQFKHGYQFVDENGDGYNDNAPDADGDGIPNGQDPDYTGAKNRAAKSGKGFVDADGDGINDNMMKTANKTRKGGYGPGDGTGNKGVRPQDGTGHGSGAQSGNCDGTGPKGNANRGGSKK